MLYRKAHLVEVTRKRSSRLSAKYCSDIQIWAPRPKDRRQMSQPQDNTIVVAHQHVQRSPQPMDALSDTLHRLQVSGEERIPKRSISRDGYGFRKSGMSTPLISTSTPDPHHSQLELVPDLHGLGWPGWFHHLRYSNNI
jgi:hypothetical protein